jgi:hypothetical protein
MDEDLIRMTCEELIDEARRLRQGIRQHRDSSLHELCWQSVLPRKVVWYTCSGYVY